MCSSRAPCCRDLGEIVPRRVGYSRRQLNDQVFTVRRKGGLNAIITPAAQKKETLLKNIHKRWQHHNVMQTRHYFVLVYTRSRSHQALAVFQIKNVKLTYLKV